MSVLIKNILLFATLAITVVPALADTGGQSKTSEILIWGFLGCCALIIVAQIAPLIWSLRKQSKLASDQVKTSEQHQPQ